MMFIVTMKGIIYSTVFISLFLIDYIFGNGFVDMFQKLFCKLTCLLKKTIQEEAKKIQIAGAENPISLPVLLTEILLLSLTLAFFNKYKQFRSKDRISELLQESKEEIQQTNKFLEKWRLRRINWQVPTERSYLDEEPQEIKPLKLEVPILHMAIIDTLGTTRSQPERGDAGDTINITDSTLLSVTSLIDDDLESTPDNRDSSSDEKIDIRVNMEYNNRYLWDVMEEDTSYLDKN